MKLVHPILNSHIVFDDNVINVLVLENQNIFSQMLFELSEQINGKDGRFVLSDEDILPLSKNAHMLIDYINLDINSKKIKSKLYNMFNMLAHNEDYYTKTNCVMSNVSAYFEDICNEFPCNVTYSSEFDIIGLTNAVNLCVDDNYDSIAEKLLDYMLTYKALLGDTVFVLANLKSYISDKELLSFYNDILYNKIKILIIENFINGSHLHMERCVILDNDLCELIF